MTTHPQTLTPKQRGATVVEFVIIVPIVLMMILGIMQTGMVYYAKSNLNYAAFEAVRAGSVGHGLLNGAQGIGQTFTRSMAGYYGGGRNPTEIAASTARAIADITPLTTQIQLLSPTSQSFDDYASPRLKAKYGVSTRVIPNNNLNAITCPMDNTSCNNNPASNASGQTLSDANILNLRITYGIPAAKQMPLVGPFYIKVLKGLTDLGLMAETDPFKLALLNLGRIPVVLHTSMRMQSAPIENGNGSNPGAGNNGTPIEPDPDPPVENPEDPPCQAGDPDCEPADPPEELEEPCDPATDLFHCLPPGCNKGDASCDPACEGGKCTPIDCGEKVNILTTTEAPAPASSTNP